MDALAGATKGIAAQKTLGDEARRVAQEVETMIGHIRRVPGVDMGAVEGGAESYSARRIEGQAR